MAVPRLRIALLRESMLRKALLWRRSTPGSSAGRAGWLRERRLPVRGGLLCLVICGHE